MVFNVELFGYSFELDNGDYGYYANFSTRDHTHGYIVDKILKYIYDDSYNDPEDVWKEIILNKFPGSKIDVECESKLFPEFKRKEDLFLFIQLLQTGSFRQNDLNFINLSYLAL